MSKSEFKSSTAARLLASRDETETIRYARDGRLNTVATRTNFKGQILRIQQIKPMQSL